MSIKKIEKINFSYPRGTLQSVYDTEEMTALELAAKTSKKVDECVDMVNVVEQTAIDATAIVDIMHIAQDQFLTENNDIRQQLVVDNQDFIETLETAKTTFEADMTAAVNDVITNAETMIEQDVTEKIDTMATDGTLADVIDQQIFTEVHERIEDIAVNVKKFGAVGDGVTDDTQAIKDAIAYAESLPSATILFPSAAGYLVKETLYVSSTCNIKMDSALLFDIPMTMAGLVIGSTENAPYDRTYTLQVKKLLLSDWSDENNVGIKIINANNCNINVVQVYSFTIGLQCLGSGGGFAYNNVYITSLRSNKIGVDMVSESNGGIGWVNENLFIGGRFAVISTENTGKSRYGVRIRSKDGTYKNNNSNLFLKPSFELGRTPASPNEAIPVLIEDGSYNVFQNMRNEQNSGIARVKNEAQGNEFHQSYTDEGSRTFFDESSFASNFVTSTRESRNYRPLKQLFNVENLHRDTKFYDDEHANYCHVKNMTQRRRTQSTIGNVVPNSISRAEDHIVINRGGGGTLGTYITTETAKEILVGGTRLSGFGGRLALTCYDADGVQLIDNAGHAKGLSGAPLVYTSDWGGGYTTGIDATGSIMFKVSDEVKKIWVGFSYGTTQPCKLKSFTVSTFNLNSNDIAIHGKENNVALKPPTVGTYEAGEILYNNAPAIGGFIGWVCTTGGTPGTWEGFGQIGITP